MNSKAPPRVKKFAAAKQRRLDDLLDKNREGTITPSERRRLEELVAEAEQLMVENAKRLASFHKQQTAHVPAGAIPVTVWVKPASTGS